MVCKTHPHVHAGHGYPRRCSPAEVDTLVNRPIDVATIAAARAIWSGLGGELR